MATTFFEQAAASLPAESSLTDGTGLYKDVVVDTNPGELFHALKSEIRWHTMLHKGGAVPRLVANQGVLYREVGEPLQVSWEPVYRHPASEAPALVPFSPLVDAVRKRCEELVGHQLNHGLLQLYRGGEDYISEHSDKTLDVCRDSKIVNFSAGATRVMVLKRKHRSRVAGAEQAGAGKKAVGKQVDAGVESSGSCASGTEDARCGAEAASRCGSGLDICRFRLVNNSLFVLGMMVNADYTHSIKRDKRLQRDKAEDELAFEGERISLTFRLVKTFLRRDGEVSEVVEKARDCCGGGFFGGRSRFPGTTSGERSLVEERCEVVLAEAPAPVFLVGQGARRTFRELEIRAPESVGRGECGVLLHKGIVEKQSDGALGEMAAKEEPRVAQRMLHAFSRENREGLEFDWKACYGGGFDTMFVD
eukprot:g14011.t1